MTVSPPVIRPPRSTGELIEHIKGEVRVARSFSPNPLPENTTARRLRKLTAAPGYREEQVRGAYRAGEQLGGYKIYERVLRIGAARLLTGCIGSVYTRADVRNQGVATALMQDAITYAEAHNYSLLLLDGIPKFYYRYGYCNVHHLSAMDIDCEAMLALPPSLYTVRPFSFDDAVRLLDLYKRHFGPYAGSFERSLEQQLHWLRNIDPHQLRVAVDPGGQVRGYLFSSGIQTSSYFLLPDTQARELAVDDWPATVALLQHHMREMRGQDGQQSPPAYMCTFPRTSPVLHWLEEQLEIADVSTWDSPPFGCAVREQTFYHRSAGWQARLVSLPALTRAMLPEWQARWQRSLINWSGTLTFAVGAETCTLHINGSDLQLRDTPITTENVLNLTPQAFTQALFGYRSITDALHMQNEELATVLGILFPTGNTWIPISDWF